MKKLFIVVLSIISVLFVGCEKKAQFTLNGNVSNAEGKSLYLMHMGLAGNAIVDSVALKGDGAFEFKQPAPECYDFYRLLMDKNGRGVTVAVDSTEVITVVADGNNFSENYTVEGSDESRKIQEIEQLRRALEQQVTQYVKECGVAIGDARVMVYNITKEFKENIFKQYILPAPDKASAYYALFLKTNGMFLFNPNLHRFDSKCFSAVATSLNNRYPASLRAKNLCGIATMGMQATRPVAQQDTIEAKEASLSTIGLFDIKLPNVNGDSVALSSLKGKVVLLDFITYADVRTSEHTLALREVYDKYNKQGLEIYQVSFDGNVHFWSTSADNLPWVCVRDAAGAASSNILLYRVDRLPSYFLINKNNEIVVRDEQIQDLAAEIEKLLKE